MTMSFWGRQKALAAAVLGVVLGSGVLVSELALAQEKAWNYTHSET